MSNGASRTAYTKAQRGLIRKAAIGLLAIVAIIAFVYFMGQSMESSAYEDNKVRGDLSANGGKTVEEAGQSYQYNERLTTILFMGIDKTAEVVESSDNIRNAGQADFIMLMVIDPDAKKVTQLHIDRDTMTDISILGVMGNVSGTRVAQLCLSHSFGDGMEQSCEFTVDAVENLLNGIEIDFYIAMNMGAIPALNDAVGGVTVNIEDDFTAIDPEMEPGMEMKLSGEQAKLFVQNRMDIGDGTAVARMGRHKEFFSGFADTLEIGIAGDSEFVGTLFDIMKQSIISNMKRGRMINEANKAIGYERGETIRLEGEHTLGTDGLVQFHVDEDALESLVLETFYKQVPAK